MVKWSFVRTCKLCTEWPCGYQYRRLSADVEGSGVPSLRSLLVVEERMRSSECFQYRLATGRAAGLENFAPNNPFMELHTFRLLQSFPDISLSCLSITHGVGLSDGCLIVIVLYSSLIFLLLLFRLHRSSSIFYLFFYSFRVCIVLFFMFYGPCCLK